MKSQKQRSIYILLQNRFDGIARILQLQSKLISWLSVLDTSDNAICTIQSQVP